MMAMCLHNIIDVLPSLSEKESAHDAAMTIEAIIDAYVDKGIFEPRTPVMATPLRDMFQPLKAIK